jgi:osmotically-inducible protein OsmY
VTENSVVYLLGIVNKTEGDAAAAIASNTDGVDKVVKVFEYMN